MILDRIHDVVEGDSDMNHSRRQFLSASAALGGGLLIGFATGRLRPTHSSASIPRARSR